jgi:Ni/Co efflux regulator RcnB
MTKETPMIKFLTVAAAACLLAASPALAERIKSTTHTSTVTHSSGGIKTSKTVKTTHVTVIKGGSGHTFTHVTTGHFGGPGFTSHRTVLNFRSFHRNFNAPRRFHFGFYNRPHGWYAHRWVYGERLPGGWFGRDYWIGNYATFGLIGPPDGYQWVRDGDDALLVDVDTGEVLQVEYGVFY